MILDEKFVGRKKQELYSMCLCRKRLFVLVFKKNNYLHGINAHNSYQVSV